MGSRGFRHLLKPPPISGTVTDANHGVLQGSRILLEPAGISTVSYAKARFSINEIAPGTYTRRTVRQRPFSGDFRTHRLSFAVFLPEGRNTEKTVQLRPGVVLLFTRIDPWCLFTMFVQTQRPRPVPTSFLVVKNGSKSFDRTEAECLALNRRW